MAVPATPRSSTPYALLALVAGAAAAVALGVYGREHAPTGEAIATLGFGSLIAMKVWLALVAGCLAIVQLLTASWMYGLLGPARPGGLGAVHRVSGAAAIVVSLPVAYHCLWSLGFQSYDNRVLVHSLTGCVVYGALVTKVFAVHGRRSPGWLVPLAGGLLLAAVVAVVLTSSVWYVREVGWPSTSTGY